MKSLILAAALCVAAAAVRADEFTDTLGTALEAYEAGDVKVAREELDYATKLLASQQTARLAAFLPDAMPGWTRDEAEDEGMSLGMSMFGGGIAAAATYRSDSEGELEITILTDSPMIASLGAMFSGLAMASGKPMRIQRVQFVDSDGELQGIIDNRVMISVSGGAALEVKKAYLEKMDFDGLKAF